MILWLILAAITLLVVGLLLLPLLRRPTDPVPRHNYDLAVYRQQLDEIERDLERGVLTEREAGAARTEVERRMLQAADHVEVQGGGGGRVPVIAAVALAALLPVAAFLAYQQLGQPQLAERRTAEAPPTAAPPSARAGAASGLSQQQAADVETMIARLAERARGTPDDLEVWLRLGRAYGLTGRPAKAVDAFQEAARISGKRPDIAAEYGESLVMLHGGRVVEQAREVFTEVLAAAPKEPRARYYQGLAAAQDGDWSLALERWTALAEDSAPNAPWMGTLRQRIADAALALGRDPASLPIVARLDQAARRAAAEATGQAAGQGRGEAEAEPAEIAGMVSRLAARLEEKPNDLEGWLMLARSYQVLGQPDLAREALAQADEIFAKAPFVRQQIAQAARDLGLALPGGTDPSVATRSEPSARGPSDSDMAAAMDMPEADRVAMIRGMVDGLAARLEEDPSDVAGWVMLLRSYRVLEEEERLAETLASARAAFPEASKERTEIERAARELGLESAAPDDQ